MRVCDVPTCASHDGAEDGISYHAVPAGVGLRMKWLNAIGNWKYPMSCQNRHILVCAKHFEENDFVKPRDNKSMKRRSRLKKG